jgi:uncharacterized membrane protein SpoIIM required for sporulation
MILDLPRFLAAQQPVWQELEQILQRLDDDPAAVQSVEEVKHFYRLYQRAAADLAKLQTFATEPKLCQYLESVVARAYAEIQEARRHEHRRFQPWNWFFYEFPAAFQRHFRAFCLALALTMAGSLFGGGAVLIDPHAKEAVLPFHHLLGDPSQRVAEEETMKNDHLDGAKATFSSSLMVNNIRVSITALALGITYGIGTVILLFYNGVILGAVVVDYLVAGQGTFLTGWLLPHGSVEIPAILIAGQGGLMLAGALVGKKKRIPLAARFREIAPDLVTLIGGVAILLVWAGIIEAFISQYHQPVLPYSVKITFGTIQLILLVGLLGRRLTKGEGEAKA